MRRDGFHSFIFRKMKENAEMIFDSSQREEREHRAQTTETSSFEFEVAFTSISRKFFFLFFFLPRALGFTNLYVLSEHRFPVLASLR